MFRSSLSKCPTWKSVVWQLPKKFSTVSDFVQISEVNQAGVLTLNRPKALNAINQNMMSHIYPVLSKWQTTKSLVIIKSNHPNVFCSGGDIRELSEVSLAEGELLTRHFYSINYTIANFSIPYVALMHGLTMGLGAGLSVHGQFRVATEKTVFAMPETSIGLFPDAGAGYFLPRLTGQLGMYLALTGDRLEGRDVFRAKLATHFCEYDRLGELEAALVTCSSSSDVKTTLNKFCQIDQKSTLALNKPLHKINECFSGNSVEDILNNLERDNSDWAQKTLTILCAASPLSLKVTHRQMQLGRNSNLAECIMLEKRLIYRFIESSDLREGVRSKIVNKNGAPKWKHSSVQDVTDAEVRAFFQPFVDSTHELIL